MMAACAVHILCSKFPWQELSSFQVNSIMIVFASVGYHEKPDLKILPYVSTPFHGVRSYEILDASQVTLKPAPRAIVVQIDELLFPGVSTHRFIGED
jgi:hypothetical protein